jgi:hypothetical protein
MSLCTNLKRLALSGGAFLLSALPAAAQNMLAPQIEAIEFGVICDYHPQGQEVEAPETNAGHVRRGGDPITFDIHTDQVPGLLGTAFGIRFLPNKDLGQRVVTMVTHHPPFGPGYRSTESWTSHITGGNHSARYFYLEYDYELAPGLWAMEVWLGDEMILRQEFTVHSGAAARALLDRCPTEGLSS